MRKMYWGRVLAQTDIGGAWVYARVRPGWYWWLRATKLFSQLVWRRYEEGGNRISFVTAWEAALAANGGNLPCPCPYHRRPKGAGDEL